MNIPETYIVIDTETTGLPEQDKRGNKDFSAPSVIEIGAIRAVKPGYRGEEFSILVNPFYGAEEGVAVLPEAIVKLTGITARMLDQEGASEEYAARQFLEFIGDGPHDIVGHNVVGFDLPILRRLATIPVGTVYDTMLIWRAWFLGMRKGEWESLDHFYGRVGAERMNGQSNLEFCLRTLCGPTGLVDAGYVHGKKHRALTDCTAAHIVFETMRTRGILAEVLGR